VGILTICRHPRRGGFAVACGPALRQMRRKCSRRMVQVRLYSQDRACADVSPAVSGPANVLPRDWSLWRPDPRWRGFTRPGPGRRRAGDSGEPFPGLFRRKKTGGSRHGRWRLRFGGRRGTTSDLKLQRLTHPWCRHRAYKKDQAAPQNPGIPRPPLTVKVPGGRPVPASPAGIVAVAHPRYRAPLDRFALPVPGKPAPGRLPAQYMGPRENSWVSSSKTTADAGRGNGIAKRHRMT